ncbi:SURF1 family protein [Jeongeupella avenae]|uniref:SURF1 family protein n=1 Tax=Antarcticirhabdus aurantiaca TaxID=2606717 RepID=A0ACD4NWL1_9HYPH|nr:SURF1 family protein [Antarcticirhabdus aurantiaca]WAJ31411.1 SURF1 family protein [Jeongeuplla avenae]
MRAALGIALLGVFVSLLALGTWQVQRLGWKTDLIARVDARLAAEPVEAPGPAEWAAITREADEYRRVALSGSFLHDRETLVQALTERGAGFWVLTPLRRPDGTLVLVNRGYVPADRRDPASRAQGQIAGEATVSGLLRLSEPGGGFLRSNDPAGDRWFSRDISAIAAAKLPGERVAPYFVDADAAPNPGGLPVGGLTVVSFRNHHLVYALTWYGLALLLAGAMVWILREKRRRAGRPDAAPESEG